LISDADVGGAENVHGLAEFLPVATGAARSNANRNTRQQSKNPMGRPTGRQHCRYSRSGRATSSICPDVIFGKDKGEPEAIIRPPTTAASFSFNSYCGDSGAVNAKGCDKDPKYLVNCFRRCPRDENKSKNGKDIQKNESVKDVSIVHDKLLRCPNAQADQLG
jgi:hypothetical protein